MNWITRDDFPSRLMRERPLAGVAVTPKCRTAYRRTGTQARQSFSSSKDRQSLRGGKRGRIKESKERRERGCKGRANDYETCALKSDDCAPAAPMGCPLETRAPLHSTLRRGGARGGQRRILHGVIFARCARLYKPRKVLAAQRRTGITWHATQRSTVPSLCPRRIMTGMRPLG